MEREIEMMEVLDYEVRSSWWASFISWDWSQRLAADYFARKVKRKYSRYIKSKKIELKYK